MAQQTLNNGETGSVIRGKINDNFTEVYGIAANPYPQVTDFASLPSAASNTGAINIVQTTTGIIGFRKLAGLYRSDGANWNYLGLYGRNAAEIVMVPAGSIAATDVQAALEELAGDIASAGGGLSGAATVTITGNQFEHIETVTATGVTASSKVFLSLAAVDDAQENCPEMLDLVTLTAEPATDALTITATFSQPTSGPVNLNWSAL